MNGWIWFGIWCVGAVGLIRFMKTVHDWDDAIEKMEDEEMRKNQPKESASGCSEESGE